jgi:hypothetical protein
MAKHASFESHREMLLKMAATWDGLAEDRERTIARQERIAKLEKGAATSAIQQYSPRQIRPPVAPADR